MQVWSKTVYLLFSTLGNLFFKMDYIKVNKELWNERTDIHFASDFYDVKSFIGGKDSLNTIELDLLGDISGKKVLHLQCHFGMDSISLARKGAEVTAVDFSEKAIAKAKELNDTVGTNVRFIQSDVYLLEEVLDEQFDVVFTSYGVVGWLPDMDKWAGVVSRFLKKGGQFVMAEFHPVIWMFSYDFKTVEFNYKDTTPIVEELEGTYTDGDKAIKKKSVSWNHGLSGVMQALLDKGLIIQKFQEFDYSPYNCLDDMVEVEEGKFQVKGLEEKLPIVYAISASI